MKFNSDPAVNRGASFEPLHSIADSLLAAIAIFGGFTSLTKIGHAQSLGSTFQPVTVTGQRPLSAYGAPEAFSRSRFGTLTQAYVLPPFTVYGGLDYEFTSPRKTPTRAPAGPPRPARTPNALALVRLSIPLGSETIGGRNSTTLGRPS